MCVILAQSNKLIALFIYSIVLSVKLLNFLSTRLTKLRLMKNLSNEENNLIDVKVVKTKTINLLPIGVFGFHTP